MNLYTVTRAKANRDRASLARAMLQAAKVKLQAQMKPVAVGNDSSKSLPLVQAVQPEIQTSQSKVWNRVKDGFGKLAHEAVTFISVRRSARLALHSYTSSMNFCKSVSTNT
jgi:hypothetical protein